MWLLNRIVQQQSMELLSWCGSYKPREVLLLGMLNFVGCLPNQCHASLETPSIESDMPYLQVPSGRCCPLPRGMFEYNFYMGLDRPTTQCRVHGTRD